LAAQIDGRLTKWLTEGSARGSALGP